MHAEPAPASERPPLGGRDIDEHGVNRGLLRCPRCRSRLVSCRGRLHERQGPDTSFWVPHRPSGAAGAPNDATAAAAAAGAPNDATAPAEAPADAVAPAETVAAVADAGASEVAWEWTEQQHTWWWSVADMEEVDNGGLSALVTSPAGPRRLVVCCDCNYGPFGHQTEDEPRLWLCCDLLHQQDARRCHMRPRPRSGV